MEMRTPNAIRLQRAYHRRKSGLVVLPVEVDETALVTVLVRAGMLDPNRTDDRQAVVAALQKLITALATTGTN